MSKPRIETIVNKSRAKVLPFDQDVNLSPGEFKNQRFKVFADTHNSANISGSTFSKKDKDEEEFILDASHMTYHIDENGVRDGFIMTTADGLGHGFDVVQCDQISNAAVQTCQNFINTTSINFSGLTKDNLKGLVKSAGQESMVNLDEYQASLAATVVRYDEETESYQGLFANVGDGMIVVLDGNDSSVKCCVGARVYATETWGERYEYHPISAQKADDENIDVIEFELDEGDIVIQMTDGVFSELKMSESVLVSDEEGQPLYREDKIDESVFSAMFVNGEENKEEEEDGVSISALQIAQMILNQAVEHTLHQRREFLAMMALLQPHIDEANAEGGRFKTFESKEDHEACTLQLWLGEIGNEEVTQAVTDYLSSVAHDGVQYHADVPAAQFVGDLNRKQFGDCATVSVMRVPYRNDELLRRLIEAPESAAKVLPQFKISEGESFTTSSTLSLDRLKREKFIPREDVAGCAPDSIEFEAESNIENEDNIDRISLVYNQIQEKSTKSEKLADFQESCQRSDSFEQMSVVFSALYQLDALNEHTNQRRDRFFGINKTHSWIETMGNIRRAAFEKLKDEANNLNSNEAINFLTKHINDPIFAEHRSNFKIKGAFGRTATQKQIYALIDERRAEIDKEDIQSNSLSS
ncbi:MAG: protein phosphatase 2C domain-containing protein [Gammaproteobacteria bacterium]